MLKKTQTNSFEMIFPVSSIYTLLQRSLLNDKTSSLQAHPEDKTVLLYICLNHSQCLLDNAILHHESSVDITISISHPSLYSTSHPILLYALNALSGLARALCDVHTCNK